MAGRLTGKNGSVYLAQSTTKLGDVFLWEYEQSLDTAECSIKGEAFMRYVPHVSSARVRVQSYVEGASPLSSGMFADLPASNSGAGTPVNFLLAGIDGSNTTPLVQGAGWIVRSQLHVAADGLITDEMEIQVEGEITITVG